MGDVERIKQKIESGVRPVKEADNNRKTGLMWAAHEGNIEVVRLLLGRGAETGSSNSKGQTALMWAAHGGSIEVVSLLFEKGANIRAQDKIGAAALMWAAEQGKSEIVQLLLEKGEPRLHELA